MNAVPVGWTTEPFSEIATYAAGRTPARATAAYWSGTGERYPWVSIADMDAYGNITQTKESITEGALRDIFRSRLVPAGTLIMSFKLTIGRVATLGVPACHNEAIIAIYPRQDIDKRYLGYFLSQFDYSELQDRAIKGQTLNQDKIDRIPVALPPRSERTAIADVLDLVRRAILTEERGEQITSRLKRAAMHDLFTRGLRGEPQKDTEVGLVPASWDIRRLEDDHDIAGGGTPLRSVDAYWVGGTIPWVKTGEVNYSVIRSTEEHITQSGVDNSSARLLPPGTILIAMFGQGVTRGRVAILGIEATCNQACAAVRPRNDRVDTRFLYHVLTSKYEELRQLAHGGQQQNLNIDIVRNFQVAVPSTREEQQEIVAVLDAIDSKIDLHRRKKAVLDELFKSLLHKLMTGEVRVADLDLSALPAPEEARS